MASSSSPQPHPPPPYPPVVKTERDPGSPSAVFVHTNLGTLFAFNVNFSDTVADLKKNMPKMHLTLFPDFKSIKIDAIKCKCQGYSYFLCDSMLVRTIHTGNKGVLFLFVDATVCEEDQGLIIRAAEGSEIKVVNEEAAVKGSGTLVMEETVHEETTIGVLTVLETALIVPELSKIDNAVQVNVVQHNVHEHEAVHEETTIRVLPVPETALIVPELAKIDNAVQVNVVQHNGHEHGVVDVAGDKSSIKKRKKPALKKESTKQVQGCNSSVVPIPPAVSNSVKEGETHGTADILRKRGDVAATNEDIVLIPVTAGSGNGLVLSASNKEVEKPTGRSGKAKMESSSMKEGRKETKKKRRLTSDRSIAVQNSPKPSAKSGELFEPKAPQNNITSSPAAFPSTGHGVDDAKKMQTHLSRKAAVATKPQKQHVDDAPQPVKSHPNSGTNV